MGTHTQTLDRGSLATLEVNSQLNPALWKESAGGHNIAGSRGMRTDVLRGFPVLPQSQTSFPGFVPMLQDHPITSGRGNDQMI